MQRNRIKSHPLTTSVSQSPGTTGNQGARKNSEPRIGGADRNSTGAWPKLVAEQIHRMSQPLTALQGTVELALLSESTTEGYRAALEESLEQLTRLNDIVTALRDLADAHVPSVESKGRVLRISVSRGPFEAAPMAVEVPRRFRPRKKTGTSLPTPTEARSTARHG
jgi:hypothetical protein